jgi:deoxyribodipyrimidine photolyase-related protein
MRRPYLSSSNYLLKMSNYKKDNKWNIIWDNSYKKYVKDKKISFYLRTIK